MEEVIQYVIPALERCCLKHEIHKFDSGAAMIDIWVNDKFYCIQLFKNYIGLSLVTEDSGFSTIPDISYTSISEFKLDFEKILQLIQ